MRLDGYGLFVKDMAAMIRFYRDVLGFEIKEDENTANVSLLKDDTLFLLYRRNDFEKLTSKRYEYLTGVNAHSEMALYVDTYEEVDMQYKNAVDHGAASLLEPTTEPWGQRTCFIADPEGNIIEIQAEYDADSKSGMPGANRKVKGTLHWVSADHCVKAEVREYDRLFFVENPSADERDFHELLNPDSLHVNNCCYVEKYAATRKPGEYLQFQRIGYFMADPDTTDAAPVFNKTVGLKDAWAKKNK